MENCIFCKIIASEISSQKIYEDELVFSFRDISPQAPAHILIIPKVHIASVAETIDSSLLGHMVITAAKIAKDEGIEATGYRLVFNCGHDAGQTVDHLHLHLLGGRSLNWPPG